MSARIPCLDYEAAYTLALHGHMIMRISEVMQNPRGYSFRARLVRNTAPFSSFEFMMSLTPEEYAFERVPPCLGLDASFHTTTREES